ncbi:MAG: TadE/TadG family type IV pilus assembly protein, partial [Steroidobacteraceae bacterium]
MNLRRRQTGLALVEFTLCVPVLLLVMCATAEVGRAFTHYSRLAHSVRDAVRHVAGLAIPNGTGVLNPSATTISQARNLAVFGNTAGTGTPVLPGLTVGQIIVANVA